jgi:predicted RNA-binding protein YlxR (DUF448 family)
VRTCIGCRTPAPKTDLLRLVVAADGNVVPDLRGSAPGRGAHLHPTATCLALAERRRAFARALRVSGPLDTSAVWAYVERCTQEALGHSAGHEQEAEQSLMNLE